MGNVRSMTDRWDDVSEDFLRVGGHLKRHFESSGASKPESDDIRQALREAVDALSKAAEALGNAVRDPQVQADARKAAKTFADAVSTTVGELGQKIGRKSD